ncbi:MAG: hypothetical protein KGZ67_14240 [Hydrogenophaga sp.]|jgi:hypothetical protein|nr:hypothetical protein [Hydrogenophaga sp.]
MSTAVQILHVLSAIVVLAEALNKLERCNPLAPGITPHARLVDGLKALAWLLLAMGAAGALAAPLLLATGFPADAAGEWLRMEPPTADQALVLAGFAVLIVRTRVKEG